MSPSRAFRAFLFGSLLGAAALEAQPSTHKPIVPCGGEPSIILPCGPAATSALHTLAVVDGQPLTIGDLDERAQEAVAGLNEEISRVRRAVLDDAINDLLLDIEARRRGVTSDQLYYSEIMKRVAPPTEEQILAEYQARPELNAKFSLDAVREGLIGRLRAKRETELFGQWTARAREQTRIVYLREVPARLLRAKTVLAKVGSRAITFDAIREPLKARTDEVKRKVFEQQFAAAEKAINRRLVEAEARKRDTTLDEILRAR